MDYARNVSIFENLPQQVINSNSSYCGIRIFSIATILQIVPFYFHHLLGFEYSLSALENHSVSQVT